MCLFLFNHLRFSSSHILPLVPHPFSFPLVPSHGNTSKGSGFRVNVWCTELRHSSVRGREAAGLGRGQHGSFKSLFDKYGTATLKRSYWVFWSVSTTYWPVASRVVDIGHFLYSDIWEIKSGTMVWWSSACGFFYTHTLVESHLLCHFWDGLPK